MKIKKQLYRIHWLLSFQFGIDVKKFINAIISLPRFFLNLYKFSRDFKGLIKLSPCLHDRNEAGGDAKSEYFWQDLLVAQLIHSKNPSLHVDVGSRIDGFVAHIASFRQIEVFDIRNVENVIPGVNFKQRDFTKPDKELSEYCDSLSCLHALEHFGLGRYGDDIDPLAFKEGLKNMSDMLRDNGTLYLSVPIGIERVEFNANYVFNPITIISTAVKNNLKLTSLIVIYQSGTREVFLPSDRLINSLSEKEYSLGVFVFSKIGNTLS